MDILAAIPSIVYGLWALFVLKPILDSSVEPFLIGTLGKVPLIGALFRGKAQGPDLFTAGVILAIMILPIVTAVSREVIAVVPRDLREAALALGATRYESVRLAVLPYARSGIVGAIDARSWSCARRDDRGVPGRREHAAHRVVAHGPGCHDPLMDREQLP